MLRRGGIWTVRVHVPVDLRPLIGRREVWRSVGTSYCREALLRAAILQGHMGALFVRLRREHRWMSKQQIEELVSEFLEAELRESETRLATGAWDTAINDHGEQGDWNDIAQMLLGEEIEIQTHARCWPRARTDQIASRTRLTIHRTTRW